MRLHRFYINQKIGEMGEITLTDSELIHQLVNVFRFKAGDKVILFDGSGFEYEAEITTISKKEIKLNPLVKIQGKDTLNKKNNVSLYLSLIKKSNFELAVEKCTEIGVTEIHPIISERSEKKDLNLERLNKIVKEASEQSGRVTLPKVFEITDLEKAVSQAIGDNKTCIVFHTVTDSTATEHNRPGHQNDHPALTKAGIDGRHQVATFVGPEGGWTEKEMNLFKQNNFQILSLGQNILRAETAAIVAVWEGLKM
jgi:16S rRNA (uracil1498-N3)-methyltransferase